MINIINNFRLSYKSSPFSSNENELKKPPSNKKTISISKYYQYETFSKIAKKQLMTFNDLFMAIVSKVSKDVLKEYSPITNYNNKTLVCGLSINLRAMPIILDNYELLNESSGQIINLKLLDDAIKGGHTQELKGNLSKYIKNHYLALLEYKIISWIGMVIPTTFLFNVVNNTSPFVDIYVANIPGPTGEV